MSELALLMVFLVEKKKDEVFFAHTSFLSPSTIFRFQFSSPEDQKGGEVTIFRNTTFEGFDQNLYSTTQVFYPSKDGTKIPMFIVHKKSMKLDGNNPTYLYGYGGFNISMTPYFSAFRITWIQNFNGIYALVNLRGGGEYGEKWHQAGKKEKKQNTIDDFHAAAEYLIRENYTSAPKISLHGGSNGGMVVGACVNQRPELYGCAIPQVGVMDMLKFHKFTIGHFWISDFGSPDIPEDFKHIYKYSPLHNINKDKVYPSILATTSDHDDRVSPLHSFKYMASLQNLVSGNANQKAPLLIRIEVKAGHGAGKPTTKIIEEQSDIYSFAAHETGAVWVDDNKL